MKPLMIHRLVACTLTASMLADPAMAVPLGAQAMPWRTGVSIAEGLWLSQALAPAPLAVQEHHPVLSRQESPITGRLLDASKAKRPTPAQLVAQAYGLMQGSHPPEANLKRSIELNTEALERESEIRMDKEETLFWALVNLATAQRLLKNKADAYAYVSRAREMANGIPVPLLKRMALWEQECWMYYSQDQDEKRLETAQRALQAFDDVYVHGKRPTADEAVISEMDFRYIRSAQHQRDKRGALASSYQLAADYRNHFLDVRNSVTSRLNRKQGMSASENMAPAPSLLDVRLSEISAVIAKRDATDAELRLAIQWCDEVLALLSIVPDHERSSRLYFGTLQHKGYLLAQVFDYPEAKRVVEKSLAEGERVPVPLDVRMDTWQLACWVYAKGHFAEEALAMAELVDKISRQIKRNKVLSEKGFYVPENEELAIAKPALRSEELQVNIDKFQTFHSNEVAPFLEKERQKRRAVVAAATKPKEPKPAGVAKEPDSENFGVGKKTAWKQTWDLVRARRWEEASVHIPMARDYEEASFVRELIAARRAVQKGELSVARERLGNLLHALIRVSDPAFRFAPATDMLSDLLAVVTRRSLANQWSGSDRDREPAAEVLMAVVALLAEEGKSEKALQIKGLAQRVAQGVSALVKRADAQPHEKTEPSEDAYPTSVLTPEAWHQVWDHFPEEIELPAEGFDGMAEWFWSHGFVDTPWPLLLQTYGPMNDFHDVLTRYVLYEILPTLAESDRAFLVDRLACIEGGTRSFETLIEIGKKVEPYRNVRLSPPQVDILLKVFQSPAVEEFYVAEAFKTVFEEAQAASALPHVSLPATASAPEMLFGDEARPRHLPFGLEGHGHGASYNDGIATGAELGRQAGRARSGRHRGLARFGTVRRSSDAQENSRQSHSSPSPEAGDTLVFGSHELKAVAPSHDHVLSTTVDDKEFYRMATAGMPVFAFMDYLGLHHSLFSIRFSHAQGLTLTTLMASIIYEMVSNAIWEGDATPVTLQIGWNGAGGLAERVSVHIVQTLIRDPQWEALQKNHEGYQRQGNAYLKDTHSRRHEGAATEGGLGLRRFGEWLDGHAGLLMYERGRHGPSSLDTWVIFGERSNALHQAA